MSPTIHAIFSRVLSNAGNSSKVAAVPETARPSKSTEFDMRAAPGKGR